MNNPCKTLPIRYNYNTTINIKHPNDPSTRIKIVHKCFTKASRKFADIGHRHSFGLHYMIAHRTKSERKHPSK
jgi:hypothetical protein